ncbi:RNA demethylase ALKB [Sesamum alatum]|uniref:RNA demethylase ALKB n=1 Tax=Sesamum alatum TaxID=300844 RepID=A0AAE2CQ56_9LAMI|nr:RNA demethylase ALKB [Sesamum alatum]
MQPAIVVVPEKIPVQWYNHQQQPPHHHMDEREGFLMWLRGEFVVANAIIDALCHHLRTVGDLGEYDGVIGSIQQRRCSWNPSSPSPSFSYRRSLQIRHKFSSPLFKNILSSVGKAYLHVKRYL